MFGFQTFIDIRTADTVAWVSRNCLKTEPDQMSQKPALFLYVFGVILVIWSFKHQLQKNQVFKYVRVFGVYYSDAFSVYKNMVG